MGREIRYAQCHFVDMSALKRNMLEHVRFIFNNFAKVTSSCVIKNDEKTFEICINFESMTFLSILLGRNFSNMLMPCRKCC